MSNSTQIDVNYFSFGTGYSLYAGSDHIQQVDGFPSPLEFTPDNPNQYAAILKGSGNETQVSLLSPVISQGHENAIDINHSKNIEIIGAILGQAGINGDQVITIKGGSSNIKISGIMHTRGNRQGVDIDIGNWSDQSYNVATDIILELTHVDGKPINVRIGRATNVTLKGGCKKMFWSSLYLKAYWWLKWTVRKVLGIKVGVKGPSWL